MRLERLDLCLSDDAPIPTVRVLVGTLEARDASSVVQKLNTRFQLTDLRHLKRVKPVFTDDGTKTDRLKIIIRPIDEEGGDNLGEDQRDDLVWFGFKGVEVLRVPSVQPLTTGQYERFNALWPVVFHRSLAEKQSGEDLRMATEVYGKFADQLTEECGCLVVDPESQEEVGRSTDIPAHHCLDHSVMRAIESVALKARSSLLPPSQYLCKAYHVLLLREPCFMCSMALVHARVASVVFRERDAVRGALCSQADCTWLQACNHRYRIYQVTE